jgi:hypothetical protein
MFKSKHSGWTFAGTRTPFGGGGGIGNAFGLGDALASIDPGPAIGDALASTDKFMTNLTPYGWALPAALVAAYFTAGGSLAAEGALEAGALTASEMGAAEAAATAAGETAFSEAVAAGASEAAATEAANAAAETALSAATSAGEATAVTATPGADAVLGSSTNIANLTPAGAGNFGSIVAPLEGSGAIPGAGAITNASGLTGAMGAGTMVGDGTLGTTIGQTYMAAAPGQFALNASGAAIPAGASGIAGTVPSTGISASDVINNAKRAKNLSDLLKQGSASGLSNSLGKLAEGANPQGQALGAVVRGNQSPFTYQPQQPIQDAKPFDLASLANLLKQG